MAAEAQTGVPADLAGVPSLPMDEAQLGDLELLLSGGFAPLTGFMDAADVTAVIEQGTLADGTPWPIPVTLDVRQEVAPGADRVLLADPEGTPLALLDITERSEFLAAGHGRDAQDFWLTRLAGRVTGLREPEHGPFRRLMLSPAEARAALGDCPVLAYATRGPLHSRQIGQLRHLAGQLKARGVETPLVLLPLIAGPAEVVTRPEALIRAVLAAAANLPQGTVVIPVPLAARAPGAGTPPDRELPARALVAAAYGATHLMIDGPAAASLGTGSNILSSTSTSTSTVTFSGTSAAGSLSEAAGVAIPMVRAGDWAYDRVAEVWRPLALIEAGTERDDLSPTAWPGHPRRPRRWPWTRGPRYPRGSPRPPWRGNCDVPARRARSEASCCS